MHADLWGVWTAWHELHVRRPVGMAPCGLPWAEVRAYCQDLGLGPAESARWNRLIGAMDLAYLAHEAKRAKDRRAGHGDA